MNRFGTMGKGVFLREAHFGECLARAVGDEQGIVAKPEFAARRV